MAGVPFSAPERGRRGHRGRDPLPAAVVPLSLWERATLSRAAAPAEGERATLSRAAAPAEGERATLSRAVRPLLRQCCAHSERGNAPQAVNNPSEQRQSVARMRPIGAVKG
jgi:hypothetical protein